MKFLTRNSALGAAGIFLLFVIISAARIGVADVLSRYVKNEMTSGDLSVASHALEVAQRIAPDNPDNNEDQAHLALLRLKIPGLSLAERNLQLQQGLEQIHDAIASRPVSPYAWNTLLFFKNQRAEYDTEFSTALERSVTLGPWEPSIQPIVANVGLGAWGALSKVEQKMVKETIARGMKRQATTMLAIISIHQYGCSSAYGNLDAGCVR